MKNYCDGGEAILEAIRQLKCDYIFSSPGSEWSSVWEALARQKAGNVPGPTYIDCWHETLAVDMSIGYTHMTGRVQTVLLHAGVGLLQGSMAVYSAQVQEVPMVVMSGESLTYGEQPGFNPGAQWYRNLSVVGGPQRLVESMTKWSSQATSVHTLQETVVRAGEMARHTPKGPTYVNVPIEVMLAEWTAPARTRNVPLPPKTQPLPEDVEHVASLVAGAKNPLIVTEDAGRDPAAFGALVELAELLALPVVEAGSGAFGSFPKSHPLHQGGGLAPFKDADVVLLVDGRAPWYPPSSKPANATIISVSNNPLKGHVVYQKLDADQYLEGDVATSLKLITAALRARPIDAASVAARRAKFARTHAEHKAAREAIEQKAQNETPINPYWLLRALREALPPDAILVDETVVHTGMARQHLAWDQPQSFFKTRGGLGQGLGVALGCKLAAPERPVVLLIGDGSLLYNPITQALGASRDLKLPILVVVFNNKGYEAMRHNHHWYYPDGTAHDRKDYYGVNIDGPDFSVLGAPFAISGRRVEAPGELAAALHEGLAKVKSGTTHILDVVLTNKVPGDH